MVTKSPPFGFRLGLLLFWAIGIAAFKWSVIGPFRLDDFALGLAVELCFWGWLVLAAQSLEPLLPKAWAWAPGGVFFVLFYASAAWVFSYTYFFDSAVERRFSLLDTDAGGMVFFLRDVLPARGWVILLALVVFIHGGAFWMRKRGPRPSSLAMLSVLALATFVTVLSARAAPRVATPLYDIVHDYRELAVTPRVSVAESTPFMPVAMLDKSERTPRNLQTPFKKVLVFVMETMTAARLAAETPALKRETFFAAGRAHSHLFDRYFPNNQDSRTGMLDLLGSRFIPYEAYRDADVDAYAGVARLPSLLDPFKRFGYRTAYAVSQTALEEVVVDMGWDTLIHLHDAEIAQLKADKKALCFHPYEFENSCEDMALLPKVFELIDQNERVFLFQELIWGHDSVYNETTGRTNAEYYSTYFDAIIAHLSERHLLDETLIVVTSDHGFRDKGLQDQLSVYRVPLIFYSPSFDETHNAALLSHLDFKDLLFDEMQPGSTPVDHNDAILIQGPTATALVAALTDDGDFMLVKSRGDARLLLSHKNVGPHLDALLPPRAPLAPSALMRLRDEYKAWFDARVIAGKTPGQ